MRASAQGRDATPLPEGGRVSAGKVLGAEVGRVLSPRAAEVELREAGAVAEGAVDGPGGAERGGLSAAGPRVGRA